MNYIELMQKARNKNKERDISDRSYGFATPKDGGVKECILTAMLAIEAGINNEDFDMMCEGQVFLEDCIALIKNESYATGE